MDRTVTIAGVEVPRFLYGTAWKEGATQVLVGLALTLGFRGIDTANQRKHYDEAAVGRAISAAIAGYQSQLRSSHFRRVVGRLFRNYWLLVVPATVASF